MTTDITELALSLKAAAEKATPGPWEVQFGEEIYATDGVDNEQVAIATLDARDADYIALANPANVLALIEALEKAQSERDELRLGFIANQEEAHEAIKYATELKEQLARACAGREEALREVDEMQKSLDHTHRRRAIWREKAVTAETEIAALRQHIAELEPIRAAAEKLVRCKGRYHSEQNYRALAALFGVTAPDLPPLDGDSCTVTIEPFRSFVTDADLAALHRFAECCDDPESGGHDLEQEQVRRLEAIGALQRSGRISYITGFGDVLISITAGIKWEAE